MRKTCVCGAWLHVDERETTLSARSLAVLAEYWRRVHRECEVKTTVDAIPDDCEVLRIMVDGGEQLCDHALAQWTADRYQLGEPARQENLQRWRRIRERIRGLAGELKKGGAP